MREREREREGEGEGEGEGGDLGVGVGGELVGEDDVGGQDELHALGGRLGLERPRQLQLVLLHQRAATCNNDHDESQIANNAMIMTTGTSSARVDVNGESAAAGQ